MTELKKLRKKYKQETKKSKKEFMTAHADKVFLDKSIKIHDIYRKPFLVDRIREHTEHRKKS